MTRKVVILVPDWSGGIDRLFENIDQNGATATSDFQFTLFNTHGRSLRGISILPFGLV